MDAEFLDDLLDSSIKPTAFITNPPFSATGGRVAYNRTSFGARYIETDLKRLKTDGRLVSIAGQGMGFDKPTFSEWWQRIAGQYTVRANLALPSEEYSKMWAMYDS